MPEQPEELPSWLEYISQQHPEVIDMGLGRFSQVQRSLNLKQPAPKVITVAGTNGKGSTARVMRLCYWMLATRSVRRCRLMCGASTSAFGLMVKRPAMPRSALRLLPSMLLGETCLSLISNSVHSPRFCMAQSQVDFAILEIGLGGRLDAFNSVDADVAVITSIGLDHQAFLGNTREAIGGEKAGILRSGQRVVLGKNMPESIYARCRALSLTPRCWGEDFCSRSVDAETNWELTRSDGHAFTVPQTRLAAHNIAAPVKPSLMSLSSAASGFCAARIWRFPGEWTSAKRTTGAWYTMCVTTPTGQHFSWKSWQPEVLFQRFSFAPCWRVRTT